MNLAVWRCKVATSVSLTIEEQPMIMNTKSTFATMFVAAGILFAPGCATESASELAAQATITRAQAEDIALTKAVGGQVKSGELEKEHGHLVWSFDIATPGNPNITEVQVDARSGKIVSVETETPAQQAKEAKEDAKK